MVLYMEARHPRSSSPRTPLEGTKLGHSKDGCMAPKAKHGDPPDPGVQVLAWREAEDALRAAGVVG